jgi:hypothetical protein
MFENPFCRSVQGMKTIGHNFVPKWVLAGQSTLGETLKFPGPCRTISFEQGKGRNDADTGGGCG